MTANAILMGNHQMQPDFQTLKINQQRKPRDGSQ